jgi:hypothetical protein
MTASISGVLIGYLYPDHPAWIPHRTVSHEDAIKALGRHMLRDCISTGDVFNSGRISGNFFLASAGFCIEDYTCGEAMCVSGMVEFYKRSKHYAIYQELCGIYKAKDAEKNRRMMLALEGRVPDCVRQRIDGEVCSQFCGRIRPLEEQLESIYRAGAA